MRTLPERLMVRNGTFYCRMWVPRDLARTFGRQLVVISLRTKDLTTAKSRLARKTIELEDQFVATRANQDSEKGDGQTPMIDSKTARARFLKIARQRAIDVSDREFTQRAELFQEASETPARLWSGELVPLPTPADFGHGQEDAYTYFDHLVAEGDLDHVLGYIVRFRLCRRVDALGRMLATGNLREFIMLADQALPGMEPADCVTLARLLLDEELKALRSILDGQPDPSLTDLQTKHSEDEVELELVVSEKMPKLPVATANAISLDDLFTRWEAETQPSASTLSSWRGITRDLKKFLGTKADDISTITSEDIVGWKDKLVKANKAAATISRGYLGCAGALFRFAISNKWLDADPSQGIKLTRKVKAGTKMLGYTGEEVARLLTIASAASEPWKRWLPWLAAATGSRIGEVAQLHGSHIGEDEGYPVVKIAPAEDAGSIKNAASERMIPIHSKLIDDGFLEFVKARGTGPLFYSRSSGDPKKKHASKGVANRLASWIRENGFNDPLTQKRISHPTPIGYLLKQITIIMLECRQASF